MGKYIVTISGTNRKCEIISETFYLDNAEYETIEACKIVYAEMWDCYSLTNIEINIQDIDKLYNTFKAREQDMERIKHVIYRLKEEENKRIEKEKALLISLKNKYPNL